MQYVYLLILATVFEFSYIAWVRAAAAKRPVLTVFWSVATAGLSVYGIGGALKLQHGEIAYLAGIGLGASINAYLDYRRVLNIK